VISFRYRLKRARRRFGKSRKGSAAIEFALVAVPFFLLTFGLAEVGMIGLAQTSLNFAISDAGRQIRTGQAQLNGVTEAEMSDQICDGLNDFLLMSCTDTLFIDVDRFDSFVDVGVMDNPLASGQLDDSNFGYAPGAPSDVVVVRAYYRWHIMTPLFEDLLGNVTGGERVLVSTMLFRNEPYL